MSRPQFENQTNISAVTSKSISNVNWESVGNVLSGWNNRVVTTIYSPVNTVSRIMNLDIIWFPISLATSGEKTVFVDNQIDSLTGLGLLELKGAHNSELRFGTGMFQNHLASKPGDSDSAIQLVTQGRFDENVGLSFVWYNNTNATSDAKRRFILFVEREVITR